MKKRAVRIRRVKEENIIKVNQCVGSIFDAHGKERFPSPTLLGVHRSFTEKKITPGQCKKDALKLYDWMLEHLPQQTFYNLACLFRMAANNMEASRDDEEEVPEGVAV